MAGNNTYDAGSISVLEGLEAVRKRPGMYIGSVSTKGLNHLIYDIVDNSVDEHLAGFCTEIRVVLEKDGTATVTDNGRGIPVDMHQKGISAARLVFTTLHAGGKFDDSAYKTSGGLHGVGSSVVNALSTYKDVKISRDGAVYHDRYERGVPVIELENGLLPKIGKTKKTGTTIKANGTTEKANLAGVTFALQSRPTGSESSVAWTDVKTYTTDSNGSINVTGLAPNDYRFIETDLGENNGYILNGKPYKFTVDNDGKIKVGSAAATETAIITADNEKPDLKKEVKKGETYANAADASIGDMVEWKVSASVPSNVDQLKKYSITDKMSNALTWVDDKAELKLTYKSNNAEVPGFTLTEGETNDY